ncbi:HAD family hydrolase [Nocardioides seonyuensis]|uniref:HAD family hydrolase n=1 Tax=Nocardioides seonyuensis TaxID=2518371 RepID=UPI001ABE3C89|nr:HAD-IA family hydrolase [Nocardioides seonyuensis]
MKTILFDLDGTLANTIPLIVASYQHAFRQVRGEEIDDTRARAWIGRPLLAALLEEDPERGHDLDRTYREWNLANTSRLIERYDGVPEMLTTLSAAGARMHVVTSKRRDTAQLAITAVGIEGLIEVAGALEDTTAHKPDPEPLLTAARRIGVDPVTAIYVGDATVDVLAAKAAGMGSIAVTWGAGERAALEAAGPDAIVDTVDELTSYLLDLVAGGSADA